MKFRLPFKLSMKGVIIIRHGEEVLYNWLRIFTGHCASPTNQKSKPLDKLTGFDYTDILSQWVSMKYPLDHVIILMNINVEAKNIQFWAKVPQVEIGNFLKDIVVLRCKDLSQLAQLIGNIPEEFAEAYGYSAGCLISYNKEDFV
jgi:hypothetical protein